MAYQAGILNEPSALVQSISSNIQKLTLLSNTHNTYTHTEEVVIISCNIQITTTLLTPVFELW